ncbi:CHAP domain-containing protein [Snodgrassella sp. ESL0253]|uniref:CHAP domain-containing protein n=1 Tax=Snodgrassella sp. ESL0253 TaxID=2705031 RepID=UPI00158186F0|nr:CHAP domain-containing protein [Snodgrassella sp. ESL0253]NUE67374.1 CHAP domain-containing protein [Snodgrassella sp. ESL0253]
MANKYKKSVVLLLGLSLFSFIAYAQSFDQRQTDAQKVGQIVDQFNGVNVYYNGQISHVSGRNLTKDGYNLGQKYQCVEFIKRYYYERFKHKMPDSYGHAKDFFDASIADGHINPKRNLLQFHNGSPTQPKVDDIIVFGWSQYGHVAIISKVSNNQIEIVQQNPGPNASSRATYPLIYKDGLWKIDNFRVLGYLRKT